MTPAMIPMIQMKVVGAACVGDVAAVVDAVDVTGPVLGATVETCPPCNPRGVPTPTSTVPALFAHSMISTAIVPLVMLRVPVTSA